jgi:hypothetical protein
MGERQQDEQGDGRVLRWYKTFKSGFSERIFTNRMPNLTETVVATVKWLKRDKLQGVWREIRGMLLVKMLRG